MLHTFEFHRSLKNLMRNITARDKETGEYVFNADMIAYAIDREAMILKLLTNVICQFDINTEQYCAIKYACEYVNSLSYKEVYEQEYFNEQTRNDISIHLDEYVNEFEVAFYD